MTYFDHAATSFPKPPEVCEAVLRAMERCASPGRGGYRESLLAAELVFDCRCRCAELFDCLPEQVVFTAGATQGLNMAIGDLVRRGDRVVVSGFEHHAVMRPLTERGAIPTVAGTKLFDREDTLLAFDRAITEDTSAVICTHISNVFGYILPIEEIAALCRRRNVPLIVDAAQSAGILPVSLRRLGAAYIAAPGHKGLLGPQGIGILLCGRQPKQLLLAGGTGSLSGSFRMPDFLPDRMEPGTANVPGIAGLLAGVELVLRRGTDRILQRETQILNTVVSALRSDGRFRCFTGEGQAPVLSVQPEREDCEHAARRLAEKQIAVRAGLHCAPLAHRSAGTADRGTLRISTSFYHTEEDAARLTDALIM